MILVTGAAGKTGQALIAALAEQVEPVRAFVRRDAAVGAAEVVLGDMQSWADFRQAADGVRAIYHIPPNMHPAEVQIGRNAIAAAQAAGVERFVYHSVLHPQIEAMPHHWSKLRVEEMLLASGLDVTILQPAVYMQNVLGQRDSIQATGVYTVPYPEGTRLSLVDLPDVAEAASRVLREDGHGGATYELCSPDSPTQTEIASLIGTYLNQRIDVRQISVEQWKSEVNSLSEYAIDTLIAMFEYYAAHGMTGSPNVLRWLLGREPTDFETFIRREFAA
jgi:NAD(P)H dehydrogenase (quinone)